MRSDNLVPLLTKKEQGLGYRQGVILTWNSSTAENTVRVGDTVLTNLNILNPSEAVFLAPGDVVGILTGGPSWAILGRLVIPNTPEATAALSSLKTQSSTINANESITSSSYVAATTNPGPAVTINVGPSGKLLVFVTADISGQTTKTSGNTMNPIGRMGFALSGANTATASDNIGLTNAVNLNITSSNATLGVAGSGTRAVLVEGLNSGSTTVTAMYKNVGDSTSINFSNRNITVMAI